MVAPAVAARAEADAERPATQSSPGAGYGLPRGVPNRPPIPCAQARAAAKAGDGGAGVGGELLSKEWLQLLVGDGHGRRPVEAKAAGPGPCRVLRGTLSVPGDDSGSSREEGAGASSSKRSGGRRSLPRRSSPPRGPGVTAGGDIPGSRGC